MSFPISGPEFLVLLLVLTVIIGPSRIPEVAKSISKWLRAARLQLAKLRTELDSTGDLGLNDIDFSALDPRQYDPRRLVKQAVQEEMDEWKALLSPLGNKEKPHSDSEKTSAAEVKDSIIEVAEEVAHKAVEEASAQAVAQALEAAGINQLVQSQKSSVGFSHSGHTKKLKMPRYGGFYRIQPVMKPAAGPSRRAISKRLKQNKQRNRS
ncbi:MttA family protein [Gleimia coleocanis DSM 15436]|uniref:MttA family protein n=1 Tax=Gleimia coleocanis DSM 15436 TaxID=525245 RepID=C0W112_9ACTO|nr:twin-arginine translocase TatA/TatE family subunit [Gleimia coleocanis]EEH63736.1 MttA family protein [Gleimia coleocanis DSM 15436]